MPYWPISSAGVSWPRVVNIRTLAGGFGGSTPGRPQQLVEVHSRAAGLALDRPHRGGQLQAVAGGDVADEAALGGHDGGDPAQRQVPGQRADLPGLACLPEQGEGARVAGPGHLAGEQLQPGAGQQPARVRAGSRHRRSAGAARRPGRGPGGRWTEPARRGEPGGGGLPPAGGMPRRPRRPSVPARWRRAGLPASPAPAPGSGPAAAARRGCPAGTAGPAAAPSACSRSSIGRRPASQGRAAAGTAASPARPPARRDRAGHA